LKEKIKVRIKKTGDKTRKQKKIKEMLLLNENAVDKKKALCYK